MLLSALKILMFFAVVLAVTLGVVQLAEYGGGVRMVFAGVEYTLGPVQMLIGLAVLFVIGWLLIKLAGFLIAFLRFIAGDETSINRHFNRSRERKGYDALSEGMLAVASGEGRLAQDKAAKAAKLLNKPHVTDLLAAQAAEVAGDTRKASEIYRRLLSDDRTRFVGVRGLMRQKLADGDTATALKLAQKAYALKPKHAEVQDTLLQLQTSEGDWKGARGVLKDKRKQGLLPQDVHIRRDAVLALKEASEVLATGNSISAREAAISANRASPDLIPAAVLAARSYIAQSDSRNASRVLQKTWSVRPHPAIAATYAEIVPDESPAARLRRFDGLIAKNPDHEEAKLLKAELLLAAEDFPGARRALGDIATKHPTVRSLSILAAVERGEGADDSVVRGVLASALAASRGPQWVCDKCHNVMGDWDPVCDSCGGFDTLTWREPDRATAMGVVPNGVELLPLLVGAPAETKPLAVKPGDNAAAKRPVAEVPDVAPGMVPRESDYHRIRAGNAENEPAMTVTDPDPEPAPKPVAEIVPPPEPKPAAPEAAPARSQIVETADFIPVRPDVEPPEDAELSSSKK